MARKKNFSTKKIKLGRGKLTTNVMRSIPKNPRAQPTR